MPFDIESVRTRLAELDSPDPARLRATIAALSRPRLTGSEAAAEVEAEVRNRFEALGYRTDTLPFSFSTWPGLYGLPVAGGIMILTGTGGGALLLADLAGAAITVLFLGLALALIPLLALEPALGRLPWGRVEARNLLFMPPSARPAWILMAHRDSKSQMVPSLARSAAIILCVGGWATLLVLALFWFLGEPFRSAVLTVLALLVVVAAGAALALSWATNESPGALDNASGLAILLEVAAATRDVDDLAFLVTDGEELGLAGARAVVPHLPPVQGVINVEGFDDTGTIYVAEGFGWRRKGSAPQLAAALLTTGAALGLPVERRPLPRTLPVDHLPIAEVGIPALTVLRGTWRSLLRVHRPDDEPAALSGAGAAAGTPLLHGAVRLLRAQEAAHLAARRGAGS
jgi:hypothetical protein